MATFGIFSLKNVIFEHFETLEYSLQCIPTVPCMSNHLFYVSIVLWMNNCWSNRSQSWNWHLKKVKSGHFIWNFVPKDSFDGSWSPDMADKCQNMFHYVILGKSKPWDSYEHIGTLLWPKLGHKNMPKIPFFPQKDHHFFRNLTSHMTDNCQICSIMWY